MLRDIVSIGDITIRGYGVMIALGYITAILVAYYRAKAYGLEREAIIDIALIAVISGILGAKLLYIIVEFKAFIEDPLEVIGSAGFVVYGGIIAGIIACMIYTIRKKISFMSYFDIVMPSIAINQGIGRIGCFFAGCCYGKETDSCIGVTFPEESMAPTGVKVLPTQLFSCVGDLLIGAFLIIYARHAKYKGNVAAMYLLVYGIGRFLIEFLRDDSRGAIGFLSTSQFISLIMVLLSIVLFVINKKRAVPADEFNPHREEVQE